jgi:hypothetical protein
MSANSQETTKFFSVFPLGEGLTFLVHKDGKDYCIEGDVDGSGTLVIRYGEAPADYSALPLYPVIKRFYPQQYRLVSLCKERVYRTDEILWIKEDLEEFESEDPDLFSCLGPERMQSRLERMQRWKKRLKTHEKTLECLEKEICNLKI